MKKLTLIILLLGAFLAVISYEGIVRHGEQVDLFMVLGLIGYIFIITAIAYLIIRILGKRLDDLV